MPTKELLRELQSMPLEGADGKIQRTMGLIAEWYTFCDNKCYVAFSGGKDSTVLTDIAAQWCRIAQIPLELVFVDTGLEYPEVKGHVHYFAKYIKERSDIDVNVTVLRPRMTFAEVIKKYGYPVISKEVSECIYEGRRAIDKCGEKAFERAKLKRLTGDVNKQGSMYD